MIITEKPYFMQNEAWYKYDPVDMKYVLTDKAPIQAIKSYEKFYSLIENQAIWIDEVEHEKR